jgi:hypothetical protein
LAILPFGGPGGIWAGIPDLLKGNRQGSMVTAKAAEKGAKYRKRNALLCGLCACFAVKIFIDLLIY